MRSCGIGGPEGIGDKVMLHIGMFFEPAHENAERIGAIDEQDSGARSKRRYCQAALWSSA